MLNRRKNAEEERLASAKNVRSTMDELICRHASELRGMARRLAPPAHIIRPGCSPDFNVQDLLQATTLKLLEQGYVPEGWEFLAYAYHVMRKIRSTAWRTYIRHLYLLEKYAIFGGVSYE